MCRGSLGIQLRNFWCMLAISWVIFIDSQGGSASNKLLPCDNLLLATKAVIRRRGPAAFSSNCVVINHQSPGALPQNTPVRMLFLTTATTNKVFASAVERKKQNNTSICFLLSAPIVSIIIPHLVTMSGCVIVIIRCYFASSEGSVCG